MTDNLMTHGDIKKKILAFAIPLLIGNLFQQMYNTADSLIVGNFLGSEALAAVSSTGSFVYLVVGFCQGFATGAGVVIARYIGAQDHENTVKAVHTAVAVGLILSALTTLFGLFAVEPILRLLGTPENVLPKSTLYLTIYFGGGLPLVMYNMFVGILQATGDSKHPLYYLIASSLLNVVLDTFFIASCGMGVEGAAIATVLSEVLSMVLVMIRLMRTQDDTHLYLSKIQLDIPNLKKIISYGLPTALQACVIDLSNLLIQSYINSFGSNAMAGLGASSKAEGFAFLPVTAISMAATTFLSQNIGAKEYERAKEGQRFVLVTIMIVIETIGIIMFVFAPSIISAFSREPEVISYGVGRMRTATLFYAFVGYSHVASAVARGLGKPTVPTIIMLVCWCAVRVTVLFTIGQLIHDIHLVYWIYPFTWMISTLVYAIYFRKNSLDKLIAEQNLDA